MRSTRLSGPRVVAVAGVAREVVVACRSPEPHAATASTSARRVGRTVTTYPPGPGESRRRSSGLARGFGRDGNGLRVGPEALDLVEVAQGGMEDVHHEIHVVEQHPAALLETLHVMRHLSGVLLH